MDVKEKISKITI